MCPFFVYRTGLLRGHNFVAMLQIGCINEHQGEKACLIEPCEVFFVEKASQILRHLELKLQGFSSFYVKIFQKI